MLSIKKISYSINERNIFDNISFSINSGEKIGLIGKNGVGKTTLLNVMLGSLIASGGFIEKQECEIGLIPQDISQWENYSICDYIEIVTGVKQARDKFNDSCIMLKDSPGDILAQSNYDDSLNLYIKYNIANFNKIIQKSLRLAGLEATDPSVKIKSLSGGQKSKVSLAAILSAQYDLILLDEPTNNIDKISTEFLIDFINNSKSAFLIISHDRNFLRNSVDRVIELVGGKNGIKQYNLGYDEYIKSRKIHNDALKSDNEQFYHEKDRLKNSINKIKQKSSQISTKIKPKDNDKMLFDGKKDRSHRTIGNKLRMLNSRIDSLIKPDELFEDILPIYCFNDENKKKFTSLVLKDLIVKYSNNKILGPFNLKLSNGDRLLVVGDNGVGKSTLLNAITGIIPIKSGDIFINNKTKIAYMDQNQSLPIEDANIIDNIIELSPSCEKHEAIIMLLKFGINKETIFSVKASDLSGGERAKTLLSAAVLNNSNLLILDEPTNNLDIMAIESLEIALNNYKNAIILTSHDEEFVSNLKKFQVLNLSKLL